MAIRKHVWQLALMLVALATVVFMCTVYHSDPLGYTRVVADSAFVVVSSYCSVGTIETTDGGTIRVYGSVHATLPSGTSFTLCNKDLQDAWIVEIGDSVTLQGVEYKGSKTRYLAIVVNEDGSIKENAAIVPKDRYVFYPFF